MGRCLLTALKRPLGSRRREFWPRLGREEASWFGETSPADGRLALPEINFWMREGASQCWFDPPVTWEEFTGDTWVFTRNFDVLNRKWKDWRQR